MNEKTVVVVGAVGGVGREIVRTLSREGYEIIALDKNPSVADLEEEGVLPVEADILSLESLEKFKGLLEERGRIYGTVFSAGIMETGNIMETGMESWERTLSVNLTAVFQMTKMMLPYLTKSQTSHVVALASHVGVVGSYDLTAYSVSKAGVIHLMKCLALDYGDQGLIANAVSPGFIRTDMLASAMKRFAVSKKWMFAVGGLPKQYVDVEDVAGAVSFLLRQKSMNGENVIIDAGYTVR